MPKLNHFIIFILIIFILYLPFVVRYHRFVQIWDKSCLRPCDKSEMSGVMRKPTFCICENKGADQLHGNREADQHHCFRFIDSTIPLLSKSEISSL